MSTIIDALSWRYAVKKFDTHKKLTSQQIQVIKEGFNLTASSYGLQPVRLMIIENQDIKEELVTASMGQEQVAQCSHLLVFCIEKTIDEEYIENYFKRITEIRATPDTILAPFKSRMIAHFKSLTPTQIEQWASKQAYLIMGNLLTICAIEAIDACPMEGFDPAAFDALLDLKKQNLKSVLIMPVGYRAENDDFATMKKVRKPLDEVIIVR